MTALSRRWIGVAGVLVLAATHVTSASAAGPTATFTSNYTSSLQDPGAVVVMPEGGAGSSDGSVFADVGHNAIIRATGSGYAVVNDTFGWQDPRDVDVEPGTGNLWVVDASLNKLVQLSPSGAVLQVIGGAKTFKAAEAVAVDATGVYVGDTYHYRVVKYRLDGSMLWQTTACGGTNMSRIRDVTVGPDGGVYATDTDNNRIVVLDPATGACVREFGSKGNQPGQFQQPRAIASDGTSGVWVTEGGGIGRVQHLTTTGVAISSFGSVGTGDSQFTTPHCVFVDSDGLLNVCDTFAYRVQRFTVNGSGVATYDSSLFGARPVVGGFDGAESVAIASDGSFYAIDIGNARLERFAADGTPLWATPGGGSRVGQLTFPRGVTIANDGMSAVVTDSENARIQIFSPAGVAQVIKPTGTTVLRPHYTVQTADGGFWMTDTSHNRVIRLSASGGFVSAFTGGGRLRSPQGLAVAPDGTLYVANAGRNTVDHYSTSGTLLDVPVTGGTAPGQVRSPNAVVLVTEAGETRLYIADAGNQRIDVVGTDGSLIGTIGDSSLGAPAGLAQPRGVAVQGSVIAVADYQQDRVALYTH